MFIKQSRSEKLRPDLGGIETFAHASDKSPFSCEKLRPDLGGIETRKYIVFDVILCEKLRPDLGGIETICLLF